MFGLTRPRRPILGTECAGEIAAIGEGVTERSVGDPVFAFPGVAQACLAGSGAFRPAIDSIHPFEPIADAHARVATGRKRGSVIVTMTD